MSEREKDWALTRIAFVAGGKGRRGGLVYICQLAEAAIGKDPDVVEVLRLLEEQSKEYDKRIKSHANFERYGRATEYWGRWHSTELLIGIIQNKFGIRLTKDGWKYTKGES